MNSLKKVCAFLLMLVAFGSVDASPVSIRLWDFNIQLADTTNMFGTFKTNGDAVSFEQAYGAKGFYHGFHITGFTPPSDPATAPGIHQGDNLYKSTFSYLTTNGFRFDVDDGDDGSFQVGVFYNPDMDLLQVAAYQNNVFSLVKVVSFNAISEQVFLPTDPSGSVPEPGTLALVAAALGLLFLHSVRTQAIRVRGQAV